MGRSHQSEEVALPQMQADEPAEIVQIYLFRTLEINERLVTIHAALLPEKWLSPARTELRAAGTCPVATAPLQRGGSPHEPGCALLGDGSMCPHRTPHANIHGSIFPRSHTAQSTQRSTTEERINNRGDCALRHHSVI